MHHTNMSLPNNLSSYTQHLSLVIFMQKSIMAQSLALTCCGLSPLTIEFQRWHLMLKAP